MNVGDRVKHPRHGEGVLETIHPHIQTRPASRGLMRVRGVAYPVWLADLALVSSADQAPAPVELPPDVARFVPRSRVVVGAVEPEHVA